MNSWIKKDLKYIWHPYTQMKDCEKLPPILIERAKGVKLYDNKDNFYYDTISSWWCNVHGHNHPKIKEAIKKQLNSLEHVLFAGFTHKSAILLSERLISISPKNLNKIFFSDNGSTAVETALKISFQYWQNIGKKNKTKFISLDYGYHGDTIGAMSVSGIDLFNEVFKPLFFTSFKIPSPYCYRCPVGKERDYCSFDCIEPLEVILKKKNNEIAGMILEPLVMAAGGMIVYPKEYLKRAAELTKRYNVHLILDEVATGFGRTGKMFACNHVNIKPDFMCLSKGITSGYLPLGVTLTTDSIYNAFYDDYEKGKTFYHGHTYTANPLSCSCALASLELFEREKTLDKLRNLIPLFYKGLEKFRDLAIVGDVRYLGLLGAMELVKNKETKETFSLKERIGLEIYKYGLKKKLILRPLGNVIYLFPPLSIKKRELEYILDSTYYVIKDICRNR
ncbi:MAG: adenosylmethionine--8-amino-7-oxononanoate transaminase [Elusimicrobia bacterium CG1_02_37_114]|nr:MAG: adenosylmethionine--8-amino-7-oxononanoate transaminase [Elusimicrobia bacterium CG1_02_37_114]PIV53534.1 MAG: adenosylmethionine--8-amino-7-oxononanoate transaminase [Elusimicrobia bacterium CG02_land_8_20_14_3_00_37_13]PIZ12709.1 MAG: adenosylmethionine--8-amino-7-oxononanoate transaminase [Elusimicrobia bacterium CG_4_10_14_0_8_um_filter_37_32]